MRKGKAILTAAIAGLGLTAAAQAAPVIGMSFVVRDMSTTTGVLLTPTTIGGVAHYTIGQGSGFRVEAISTLSNPYVTDEFHTDANDDPIPAGKVLGIQFLDAQIVAGGTNIVSAVTPSTNTTIWGRNVPANTQAANQLLTTVTNPPNYSVGQIGAADGDLDVTSLGYVVNNIPEWRGTGTGFSVGVSGGEGTNFARGAFLANNPGSATISANIIGANVWADPASAQDNTLQALTLSDPGGATVSNVPIVIDVTAVPEPASMGLLGVAAMGLFGRRRRS
jgi:hypothetical protein